VELMKAAVLQGPKQIEVQEISRPKVRPQEVLVNVQACGICTFERRLYSGERKMRYPLIAGHEAAGVVAEVGSEVRREIKVGAKVALDLLNRCGECKFCRTSRGNLCENMFKGNLNVMGGFGQYVSVPSEQVFIMDDQISIEEATLAEPVACCIHSLLGAGARFADDLLVYGAGTMGMIHVMLGAAMGMRVSVFEPQAERRKLALELGASQALLPGEEGQLSWVPDVIVVTVPLPSVVEAALQVAGAGTKVVIYSSFDKGVTVALDVNKVHNSDLAIVGAQSRTPEDFHLAVKAISAGLINVRPLVSRVVPLQDIAAALAEEPGVEEMRVVVKL